MCKIVQLLLFAVLLAATQKGIAGPFRSPNLQSRTVSGLVTDEKGTPLSDVTVQLKGTTRATATDSRGNFSLAVNSTLDSLEFSHVGYYPRVMAVGAQNFITVKLEPASSDLNSVTVVGYGTQKKISVTGALSSVSVKEVQRVSTPSLSNAIAGKLPGIISRQSSGEPGYDAAQVYIRGLSTFVSNGPLILIDGVERDLNQINAQEVESFTILKDASATAVYGVRGANGVILINTKRGVQGKPNITYRAEAATLRAMRLPDYINGQEFALLMNEALQYSGQAPRWSEEELKKFGEGSDPLYPSSDWTNATLKKNTWQTIHNLSVNGGTDLIKYYTNVGFTAQNGIYKQDPENKYNTNATIKRYNFRSNVDIKLSPSLTMQLGLGGIIQNGNYPGFSAPAIFQSLALVSPIAYPIRNPDGTPGGTSTYVGFNPWGRVTQSGYSTQDRSTLQGTFAGKWDLSSLVTKGLSLRGLFSYDRYAQTNNVRTKEFAVKRYLGKDTITGADLYSTPYREEKPLAYAIDNSANRAIYTELQVNYERSLNRHNVTSMLLYNQRDYVNLTAAESVFNIPYRRQGLAGRATYSYATRYLAEVNFGYNGSENFPKGKRFGFFPAVSLGWVVSNEDFWKLSFINNLKIRASRGKVGNDQIGHRFLFLSTINTDGQYYLFGPGQERLSGMEENAIGNNDVTWETATKNDIGLDLALWNSSVTLQVDAFNEHREHILLQRQTVPSVAGFYPWSIPYGNLGKVDNKGIDGLLEVKHTTKGGFFYSFRGNYTYAKNTVIENDEPKRRYPYLSGKGLPLGQSFAFVADGFFQDIHDIETSPRQVFSNVRVGDVKYKDINGDGVVDAFDQIPVGYPRLPQMSFGFGSTVAYKDFDASVYFTGAARTSIFLSGYSMWPFYDGMGTDNVLREYYDNRWTPSNPNALYPAIDVGNNPNNYLNSTLWMRNGNYLRLRNAEIGYTLPKKASEKAGIKTFRLFVNGINLITWDYIKIIDPESNDGTGGYPLQRSFNVGLQVDFK